MKLTVKVKETAEPVTLSLRETFQFDPDLAEKIFSICYNLYTEAFPDKDEIQSADILRDCLLDPSIWWDIIAVYVDGLLMGARHFTILESQHPETARFAAGEHLYIRRDQRRKGYGRLIIQLTEEQIKNQGACFITSEQNDPFVMSSEQKRIDALSGITTEGRLQFWRRLGYLGIDQCYYSPPLEEGRNAVYHLKLAIKKLAPTFPDVISSEAYLAVVKAIQSQWTPSWDTDRVVLQMKERIVEPTAHFIDLLEERSRT